jgi:hypothetical protein
MREALEGLLAEWVQLLLVESETRQRESKAAQAFFGLQENPGDG